ncbi:AarF/ABC1/UbiB kinase family protein [Nocardia sp. BMG51109]|uniref:ABC1 kinase family protein n=1 Tax=Nocardia sp. BMG51109 TaxID=1056816 RepID=UPI00046589BD|nr:AarF/UbiB family protein [Nocardia sp. BMG51109]
MSLRRGILYAGLAGRLAADFLAAHNDDGTAEQRMARRRSQRAVTVRKTLEELGPFFTKIGQVLATRPDFVSGEMIAELEALQSNVTVEPFELFEPVLCEELGPDWRSWFADIDTVDPLGSASLAQVYRVTLADGTDAVLKIQRPGTRARVLTDMVHVHRTGAIVSRLFPRLDAVIDIGSVIRVITDAMRPELDFTVEAENMKEARRLARDFAYISVPEVIHTTPRVLLQSMAPGAGISAVDPGTFSDHEREAIGRDLLRFMYHSYFVHRYFHADPHPGNIFVHPGAGAWLIDWGMVGRLDRHLSALLLLILTSIAQNDGNALARAWMEAGQCTEWADIEGFSQDMSLLVPRLVTSSLEQLSFGATLSAVLRASAQRGIRSSPLVGLLGKSFSNVEGSIRCFAPQISPIVEFEECLGPVMRNLLSETLSRPQLARHAMEFFIGGVTVAGQAREVFRDLSSGRFGVRATVVQPAALQRAGAYGNGLGKPAVVAAALVGGAVWLRDRRRRS